jgi:hypothetical protein
MKKFFVSLGLAAAGTASLHAAYTPDSQDNSKLWSLSATLRGFYDDNYTTTPKKHGSTGFEVSPSFNLNVPLQQTEIGLRYTYALYYYQQRENNGQKPIDQTHQFDLWLDHAFTPNWNVKLEDTVAVQQDPGLTANGTATAQRISGNNLANTATISLHTDWTRQFSTELVYQNTLVDYENSGVGPMTPAVPATLNLFPPPIFIAGTGSPQSVRASYAGLLNRIEQTVGLDFQWHISRQTMALVGYKLGLVNFTGNELIAYTQAFPYLLANPVTPVYSKQRDNMSHYLYVGVQHDFLDNLKGTVKAGAQYTDYYNDPNATTSVGPYADASLIYTYASGSYAQLGVTQSRNATDTIQVDSLGHITQDQESTVAYASVNQPLTPKLMGSVLGRYQYSIYNQGGFNNRSSEFYNLGLNLSYAFNRHFSSDVGYNFDWYTTPVPGQGYTRNRIYLGVTATY